MRIHRDTALATAVLTAILSLGALLPAAAGIASAQAAGATPAPGPCVDQCELAYGTCLYNALASRNACMLRCSMRLQPKQCYPSCRKGYQQWTQSCDSIHNQCLAVCP